MYLPMILLALGQSGAEHYALTVLGMEVGVQVVEVAAVDFAAEMRLLKLVVELPEHVIGIEAAVAVLAEDVGTEAGHAVCYILDNSLLFGALVNAIQCCG